MAQTLSGMRVRVVKEWNREFPELAVYKPLWLGRILGPLFQGICLNRTTAYDGYTPHPHLFCLCRTDWDEPPLSPGPFGGIHMPNSRATFEVKAGSHDRELALAVRCVREQALLPLEGPLTLDQVVQAYRDFVNSDRLLWGYNWSFREDVSSMLAYYGRVEEAVQAFRDTVDEIRALEARILIEPDEHQLLFKVPKGGSAGWLERETARVRDVEGLRATVEENIVTMKMQKLPRQELVV